MTEYTKNAQIIQAVLETLRNEVTIHYGHTIDLDDLEQILAKTDHHLDDILQEHCRED